MRRHRRSRANLSVQAGQSTELGFSGAQLSGGPATLAGTSPPPGASIPGRGPSGLGTKHPAGCSLPVTARQADSILQGAGAGPARIQAMLGWNREKLGERQRKSKAVSLASKLSSVLSFPRSFLLRDSEASNSCARQVQPSDNANYSRLQKDSVRRGLSIPSTELQTRAPPQTRLCTHIHPRSRKMKPKHVWDERTEKYYPGMRSRETGSA